MSTRNLLPRLLIHARRVFANDRIVLTLVALLAGVLGGAMALLFREMIAGSQALFFGTGNDRLAGFAASLSPWHRFLAPAVGGLLVGLMVRSLLPDGRPQGVADVIAAVALRGGRLPLAGGLAAGLVNAVSLGAGASLGREGPVVHLAAAASSALAAGLRLSPALTRTLLGCAVAAGVAASFNAPLAGVIFALEVVTGNAVLSAFVPVVMAAAVGTVMARLAFGDFPAFILPALSAPPLAEFPSFALLGLGAGLVAAVFARAMLAGQDVWHWAGRRTGVPRWLHPVLGGLMLGALAVRWPEVLGVGYEATDTALKGGYGLEVLTTLFAVKLAAAVLSFAAGFGGGVFSPSLMLGALAGGAFGIVADTALPAFASDRSLYATVGMGAVAAAVLGAPVSTILIIFEMTANYPATLAAMLGVVVSTTVMRATTGTSLFHLQLARAGIDAAEGPEVGLLATVRVRDLMRTEPPCLSADADAATVAEALRAAPGGLVLVADPDSGAALGVVTATALADRLSQGEPGATAADLAEALPTVGPADDLRTALARFDQSGVTALAVVDDRGGPPRALGLLHERDALRAYRRLIGGKR